MRKARCTEISLTPRLMLRWRIDPEVQLFQFYTVCWLCNTIPGSCISEATSSSYRVRVLGCNEGTVQPELSNPPVGDVDFSQETLDICCVSKDVQGPATPKEVPVLPSMASCALRSAEIVASWIGSNARMIRKNK